VKHLIFFVAMATLTAACSHVYSDLPIGAGARIDPSMWEGEWRGVSSADQDHWIRVHVVDAANGELVITAVEDDPSTGEPTGVCDVKAFVGRTGHWTFVNIPASDIASCGDGDDADDETSPSYVWAVVEITDDVMLWWAPRAKRFDELVDRGELPGDRADRDVTLHPLEAYHYDLIEANAGALFDWRHPEMWRRIQPVQTP
jgi:hypothetical protein